MKGVFTSRVVPVLVVVPALAAAAGLAMTSHVVSLAAGSEVSVPAAAAVSAVTRACPAPGLAGSPGARVAVVAQSTGSGPGQATVTRAGTAPGRPLLTLSRPLALSVTSVRDVSPAAHAQPVKGLRVPTVPGQGGVVVQASGSMARGLEVEQIGNGSGVLAQCQSPGTDSWFAGPGHDVADRIQLYLMNVDGQPADVNVEAFTDAGPLQGSTDTGISVAPHTMVVQSLGTLLHGSRVIALHVRTSVGQVVAGLEEFTGKARSGAWLPAAVAPARSVVIPGLPGTAGTRQLFIAVPGTQGAHITLAAITSRGSYRPTGGGGLDIPGGSAVSVSLPSLGGIPGAVKISASVPITATLMIPGGQSGTPGIFTAAAPPVTEQGVTAYNVSGAGRASQLVLTAPGTMVRARVAEVGAGKAGQVVEIKAHHSLVVQTGKASSRHLSVFAVVVTPLPGSGPLYAARVIAGSGRGGTLQSILPVPSALTTVPLPVVRNSVIILGR